MPSLPPAPAPAPALPLPLALALTLPQDNIYDEELIRAFEDASKGARAGAGRRPARTLGLCKGVGLR